MINIALTVVAGLAFAPLAASAQPGNANVVLRGQMQVLQAAGFSGMAEVAMPQAPAAVRVLPVSAQADETSEALAALIRGALLDGTLNGEGVRALGFNFKGDLFPVKSYAKPADQTVITIFSVTTFRGKTDIIISQGIKETREVRNYLISPEGVLEAASVWRKVNGSSQAESIPVSQAQAGSREMIQFWVRYYRENLKKP
ncbi:MAG: hypothetical protein M0D55_09505 [Elusimicrobiota bacterium]|nr:MAG: hypothetical protein M0D55_09505 [Elusimicrobiota bacterium]